jgi:hypothetical protein
VTNHACTACVVSFNEETVWSIVPTPGCRPCSMRAQFCTWLRGRYTEAMAGMLVASEEDLRRHAEFIRAYLAANPPPAGRLATVVRVGTTP